MKNSIRLKHNVQLSRLLERPNELALLIKIAFYQDVDTGRVSYIKINPNKSALDNLLIWGLVEFDKGYLSITNKKVIDITLKRKGKEEIELHRKLLREVAEDEVPEEESEYFRIALSFNELFLRNIRRIKSRDFNIINANYKKWVTPVRLMIESDKITIDQLRKVHSFLDGHHFWSANVQSTQKLREKFQTIYTQSHVKSFIKPDNSARTVRSERKTYD